MVGRAVSVTDAARNFSEYLNQVLYKGEQFVLMRGRRPVAVLGPAPRGVRLSELPTLLAGLSHLSPAEAESFARDIEKSREEMGTDLGRDPWPS